MTSASRLDQVSALFDQWASTDRAQKMADGHKLLMETLLAEIADTASNKALLDMGCGTGKFLALADAVGFAPTAGIDASPKMIQTSQNSAPNADVQVGQFEVLPWSDQNFDQVTSIEALYYCPDPAQAFCEIARVLRPNGRLDMIIDYYAESSGTRTWDEGLGFKITRLSTQEWVAVAESAGFQNCQSRRIVNPQHEQMAQDWTESVWYPTQESYSNYLDNGAFWLTAYL